MHSLKIITTDIVAAYSECPIKAFRLFCEGESGVSDEYQCILQIRKNKGILGGVEGYMSCH